MSVYDPTCPTGCASDVPALDFDFCDPAVSFGEIERIFVAPYDTTPFTDVESLAEWTARLDNTTLADPDLIRYMDVSADLPKGEREKIQISRSREISTPAKFTINVTVDDLSDLNYEFMRTTYCNTLQRFWFLAGNYIYGGNEGIPAIMELDLVIERGGKKSLNKFDGTVTWEHEFPPERNDSPWA